MDFKRNWAVADNFGVGVGATLSEVFVDATNSFFNSSKIGILWIDGLSTTPFGCLDVNDWGRASSGGIGMDRSVNLSSKENSDNRDSASPLFHAIFRKGLMCSKDEGKGIGAQFFGSEALLKLSKRPDNI